MQDVATQAAPTARGGPQGTAGFRLTAWRVQFIAGSSVPVQHLVYSDGLASVSVFIEPADPRSQPICGGGTPSATRKSARASRSHA